MIGCPSCGSSSAVQIMQDPAGDPQPVGFGPRWSARCDACSTDWVFRDE